MHSMKKTKRKKKKKQRQLAKLKQKKDSLAPPKMPMTTGRSRGKSKVKKSYTQVLVKETDKLNFYLIESPIQGYFENPEEQQSLEREYLDKFNEITKLNEQKNIKFFHAIGNHIITEEEHQAIANLRNEFQDVYNNNLKQEGVHRYQLSTNADQPRVDINMHDYLSSWDFYKNDPLKKRRLVKRIHFYRLLPVLAPEKIHEGRQYNHPAPACREED